MCLQCLISVRFGRTSYDKIAGEIRTKSAEEVERYSLTFWTRVKGMENGSRYIERITKGEAEIDKVQSYEDIIEAKFGSSNGAFAVDEIHIDYGKTQPSQQ
jgi:hypothetical protein